MMPGASGGMGGMAAMMGGGGGQPGAGGPDQALKAITDQIRAIGQQVQQLESTTPVVAEEAQQINALLKQIVIKVAQAQSAQTASGMAVPGGAGPV